MHAEKTQKFNNQRKKTTMQKSVGLDEPSSPKRSLLCYSPLVCPRCQMSGVAGEDAAGMQMAAHL